jgi:hypothetical protein
MASELVVDNGGYGDRLRAIADWMEDSFARMLYPLHFMDAPIKPDMTALKAYMEENAPLWHKITVAPPQMSRDEEVQRQREIIAGLQKDISLLRKQLHEEWEPRNG